MSSIRFFALSPKLPQIADANFLMSVHPVAGSRDNGVGLIKNVIFIILGLELAESVVVAPVDAAGIAQQAYSCDR